MHPLSQKIRLIIYVALGLVFIILLLNALYPYYANYTYQKKKAAWIASQEKPYREDIYGGKTPEETWNLFLTALEKEDIEEASRYFVVDKREKMKEELEGAKKEGRMEKVFLFFNKKLIEENPENLSRSQTAYYHIQIKDKNGETEAYGIVFKFNEFTHVWKISLL